MNSQTLINELIENISSSISKVKKFQTLSLEQLNWKNTPDSWSILECIEHLNLYSDFYLPTMEFQINHFKKNQIKDEFTPGWLGNYFANSMKVQNNKVNKMKAPKDKIPMSSSLNSKTLDIFFQHSEKLILLLNLSKNVDLNQVKCPISISKWIKLKLGDTLRFYTYHIERHIWQAEKVLPLNN